MIRLFTANCLSEHCTLLDVSLQASLFAGSGPIIWLVASAVRQRRISLLLIAVINRAINIWSVTGTDCRDKLSVFLLISIHTIMRKNTGHRMYTGDSEKLKTSITRSVAAGFGRQGMPPPASNDTDTALGQDGSD